MNRLCNYLVAGLLIGASAFTSPLPQANAQSAPEPAVIISVAEISQQLADANYLVEAAGFGDMKFFAQTMIKQYTKGIDPKSPAGVMLYFNQDTEIPDFVAFVPLNNLDDLLDTIAGMAEIEEGEDYTTIVTDDGTELLIKKVGEVAFLSNKVSMFDNLPNNPVELLGDMPAKFNLSAKVFAQRVPQSLRDKAMQGIRDGYEQQLELLDENEPVQAELQRKNFDFQMKQFEMWLTDTDNLTIGMCADKESGSLFVDFEMTAVADSDIAKRFAAGKSSEPSQFKGFLIDGASLTQNGRVNISADEAADYEKATSQLEETFLEAIKSESDLSDEDSAIAEKAIHDLVVILHETLEEGVFDSGAVVMLEESSINLAAGVQIADPKKLEAVVKDLVAVAEQKAPGEIQVELNSGSHKDVTFHRLVIDVPDDQDEFRDVIGDQITVMIGIGKKTVYVGAGSDPLPLLKQAMDNAGPSDSTNSIQYNLYLAPILKFAASIEGEPTLEKMAAELAANGKDRIFVESKFIENGMSMRSTMQDGILALIKVGMENFGAGGFPGGENEF